MKLDFEETLILDTMYHRPKLFVVVGAGGTGGYFIPQLTRQIALQNGIRRMEGLEEHQIVVIDQDTVSLNNLNRQNFIESDLDRNKAQVLAERYGRAFKTGAIRFLDEYITSTDRLVELIKSSCFVPRTMPVLVDCVDNNKTRVFLHEAAHQLSEATHVGLLSSGNELYTGQVVFGFLPKQKKSQYVNQSQFRTPLLADMFPEVLEGNDKLPTELSCDEAAVSHPQSIMTNMTAASFLFNFANILLLSDPDNETMKGLTYFAQTFDLEHGTIRRFPTKKSVINFYLHEQ